MGREKLEVVSSFWYLGDCLSLGGGCELAPVTIYRVKWGQFYELLSILTSHSLPITSRGRLYNSYVRSNVFHTSETWASTSSDLPATQWPSHNPLDVRCPNQGPGQLTISPGEDAVWRSGKVLRTRRHKWHIHVERCDGWMKKVQKLNPSRGGGPSQHNTLIGKPGQKWFAWTA